MLNSCTELKGAGDVCLSTFISALTQSKSQRDVENPLKNTQQGKAQQNHTEMF